MADEMRAPRRGPMGRGMNQGPGEKAKDFNSAIKRLTHELKSFKYIILSALILAIIGAILSIFAPNRLSELTDEISKGIMQPIMNMEHIKRISIMLLALFSKRVKEKDSLLEINQVSTLPSLGRDQKLVFDLWKKDMIKYCKLTLDENNKDKDKFEKDLLCVYN